MMKEAVTRKGDSSTHKNIERYRRKKNRTKRARNR